MTETWHEVSFESKVPVDSAGCVFGNINRPARTYLVWAHEGEQSVQIKIPEAPNGWIESKDAVDLESMR